MKFWIIALVLGPLCGPAQAQTLTPEEILAQIEAKVSAQNPYQALLNDPDPSRSLAAMEVMIESGDPKLVQMAVEFGMLSSNPQVRRTALHGIMSTQPVLTLVMDGTEIESGNFDNTIQRYLTGSVSSENVGFATVGFGAWKPEESCYVLRGTEKCGLTVNAQGYFLRVRDAASVQMDFQEDGSLVGSGNIYNVPDSVPMTMRLID